MELHRVVGIATTKCGFKLLRHIAFNKQNGNKNGNVTHKLKQTSVESGSSLPVMPRALCNAGSSSRGSLHAEKPLLTSPQLLVTIATVQALLALSFFPLPP